MDKNLWNLDPNKNFREFCHGPELMKSVEKYFRISVQKNTTDIEKKFKQKLKAKVAKQ